MQRSNNRSKHLNYHTRHTNSTDLVNTAAKWNVFERVRVRICLWVLRLGATYKK